jgi:hypothetical protein
MTSAIASAAMGHAGHVAGSSGWIGYVAPVVVLISAMFAVPLLAMWLVRRWELGGEDSDDGYGHGGGGGGPGGDPRPSHDPPDFEPDWWPDFERQFAAYVNGQLTPVG